MHDKLLMLSIKLKSFLADEQGQDLIEYTLVVSLIAFAAVSGMHTLANDINTTFNHVGTRFTSIMGS